MKNNLIDFILIYEQFLVVLQERYTHYHTIKKYRSSLIQYLVNVIQYECKILNMYRLTKFNEHRILLNSLNQYIHYE